jgi:hypothetical protein
MAIPVDRPLSILEEVKIQARVLVPLLRALRTELGEQRANQLVTTALREWSRRVFQEVGAKTPGSPLKKWSTLMASITSRVGTDVDWEVLRNDAEAVEFNITGCRYAEFFRQLGEPELGAVLLCESDLHVAELGGSNVEFTRTQTIMKGGQYCNFRYKLKHGAGEVTNFLPK